MSLWSWVLALTEASSVGSESAPHFNMSLWSWVRALTEVKEKGMGHAPIACEWDHPSSEWARGWALAATFLPFSINQTETEQKQLQWKDHDYLSLGAP